MNLKISKWANVVGKVKMSLCDWGPAMANVLSSNRDKNLSWPSEAWTQKSEEHGRALIYTKGSGRRGHDGDEKGDTESPRASLLVFALIPLRDLQNKWVSSRRRKLKLPAVPPLASNSSPNAHSRGHHSGGIWVLADGKDQSVLVPKSRQMLY